MIITLLVVKVAKACLSWTQVEKFRSGLPANNTREMCRKHRCACSFSRLGFPDNVIMATTACNRENRLENLVAQVCQHTTRKDLLGKVIGCFAKTSLICCSHVECRSAQSYVHRTTSSQNAIYRNKCSHRSPLKNSVSLVPTTRITHENRLGHNCRTPTHLCKRDTRSGHSGACFHNVLTAFLALPCRTTIKNSGRYRSKTHARKAHILHQQHPARTPLKCLAIQESTGCLKQKLKV